MMKLRFEHGEYEVLSVHYSTDNEGIPVDIIVFGTESVLTDIEACCSVGSNIRKCTDEELWELHTEEAEIYTGLFARLKPFSVLGDNLIIQSRTINRS